MYFVDYPAKGIQIAYYNSDNAMRNVFFCNKQRDYEKFATFRGKTDMGVDWKSSPKDVLNVYGKPKESYSGQGWQRVAFDGIDFRWENDVMVRIGVRSVKR